MARHLGQEQRRTVWLLCLPTFLEFSKELLESEARRLWIFLAKESGVKKKIRIYCSPNTCQAQL